MYCFKVFFQSYPKRGEEVEDSATWYRSIGAYIVHGLDLAATPYGTITGQLNFFDLFDFNNILMS